MSTIAWDGNELAGDRAAWSGCLKYRVRKVHKVFAKDGTAKDCTYLVGICGNGSWVTAWMEWKFLGGPDPGPYFDLDMKKPQIIALVVDSRRRVWEHTTHGHRIRRYGRLHATGAGQEFAIGAMAAGATSRRAIEIAIRHSDVAGLGVDVVGF